MKELVAQIRGKMAEVDKDLVISGEKGHGWKAAALRARKGGLELERMFKQFRQASVQEAKRS